MDCDVYRPHAELGNTLRLIIVKKGSTGGLFQIQTSNNIFTPPTHLLASTFIHLRPAGNDLYSILHRNLSVAGACLKNSCQSLPGSRWELTIP